jgi:hypothetical protein
VLAAAARAVCGQRQAHRRLRATVGARGDGRLALKVQRRAGGQRILAQNVEIKLHGIVHHAGEVADHQIDACDGARIGARCCGEDNLKDALGDGKFVHGCIIPCR